MELTAAEQLANAQDAVAEARVMVEDLMDSSTAEEAAAAYTALGEAQTALHTASGLPENKIAAKQEEIDDLQEQVDQLTIDLAEATKEPDPPTAEMIVATAAAATKLTELGTEAKQTTDVNGVDGGLGGSTASALGAGIEGAYALSIKRDRMATTVTVTVKGAPEDDDVEFMQPKDFGDGRTMHTRAMEAADDGSVMQEIAIVYTDIDPPTDIPFALVEDNKGRYTLDVNPIDPAATSPVNQSLNILPANMAMIATDWYHHLHGCN